MALKTTHLGDRGYGFGHGRSEEQKASPAAVRFPLLPALLLGLGLGGLLDGVVLHQLLQWHHMLSSWYPIDSIANLRINTLWDGIFHSFTYVLIVTGVFLLWRAAEDHRFPWTRLQFAGAMLCGWGVFNVVEGLVNHILLAHAAAPGDLVTSHRSARAWPWLLLAVGLTLALAPIWRLAGAGFEPTLEQLLQLGCLRDRAQAQSVPGRME